MIQKHFMKPFLMNPLRHLPVDLEPDAEAGDFSGIPSSGSLSQVKYSAALAEVDSSAALA